jgi:hypothetical protein
MGRVAQVWEQERLTVPHICRSQQMWVFAASGQPRKHWQGRQSFLYRTVTGEEWFALPRNDVPFGNTWGFKD